MSEQMRVDDEAYQAQLDQWAHALAKAALDLIDNPVDAAGILLQASMVASLRYTGLREYAEANLAAAQATYDEIMALPEGTTH